jgi:UDP-N-acetyl-D-glucosamine dehydrogenase
MQYQLIEKIESKKARIVVVGIGYVGLPLVVEFARAGYRVTGYDRDPEKVRLLNSGESYIGDISSAEVGPLVEARLIDATTNADVLSDADAVIVCVPTPLNKTKEPDMRFIVSATDDIVAHQHAGMLVVLESTTYPGTTREFVCPRLSESGTVGKDIFVAFSPERVDPGNTRFGTRNTPKVIGGRTPGCLSVARALYTKVIDSVVAVSSTDAAEMVKLLENTFRAVNIGLVNEFAVMCHHLGVDVWEVIRAAASKPFGFMPFFPGPGLGGHCIPIDPLYLSWRLRSLNVQAQFIELADAINSAMPMHVVGRVVEALNRGRKAVNGSRILIAGVAYKANVGDVRESPAFEIMRELRRMGGDVEYMDPHVRAIDEQGLQMRSVDTATSFAQYDAVVIVTHHASLDYRRMLDESRVIVDTRDALREHGGANCTNVLKL